MFQIACFFTKQFVVTFTVRGFVISRLVIRLGKLKSDLF